MEHSAVLLTCIIKLLNGFQPFVLSIFEWPLKTGFTVSSLLSTNYHRGNCPINETNKYVWILKQEKLKNCLLQINVDALKLQSLQLLIYF